MGEWARQHRRRPTARVAAAAVAAWVTGCDGRPAVPPEAVVSSLAVPVLTATSRPVGAVTRAVGRVVVTVEPVPYAVRAEAQEWADDGQFDVREGFGADGSTAATPVVRTLGWRAAVPVVTPDRVAFVVTVANSSGRTFRGRGASLRFEANIDGRRTPSAAVEGMGLAAVVVEPGERDRVTVYGPPLADVPAGSTVGLRVVGLPEGVVTTGVGAADPDPTWWYAVDKQEAERLTLPVVAWVKDEAVGPTVVTASPFAAAAGGRR